MHDNDNNAQQQRRHPRRRGARVSGMTDLMRLQQRGARRRRFDVDVGVVDRVVLGRRPVVRIATTNREVRNVKSMGFLGPAYVAKRLDTLCKRCRRGIGKLRIKSGS